ncbi:MAG: DnaB-like helicase C-terminal domain-containing protein [Nitrospira sp.]
MDTHPDRALIYAIIQGGVTAFQHAKSAGIQSEFLVSAADRIIFDAMNDVFLPKGKMPSISNIRQHYKIDIEEPSAEFDVDLCCQEIMKRALMTRLNVGLEPIEDMIPTDPFGARDALGQLVKETNWSLGTVMRSNSPQTIQAVLDSYLLARSRDGGLLGLSSPWPSRDKVSLGLQPGEVTVMLAKRKTGKSWLLLKWVEHIIHAKLPSGEAELKPGECILVVSMEMPTVQVYKRLFAIEHKLDYELFRGGKLSEEDDKRFVAWAKDRIDNPDPSRPEVIVAASDRCRTVDDIVGLVAQYRPRAVFIDSFYILEVPHSRLQMWERMIYNIKAIKLDIAVGFNIPVVTNTQLSGQVKKGDMNAEADAVAYAKAIGDYADAIDGIFGNTEFRGNARRIIRGMEAREFKPVDIEIKFDPSTHDYSEIRVLKSTDDGSSPSADGPGGNDKDDDDDDDPFYNEDSILVD